ncbi:MAG: hypothetical protein GX076_03955 [Clostridiales bacterium]|nr:hypothetical protein [Clostridiales bacterium]
MRYRYLSGMIPELLLRIIRSAIKYKAIDPITISNNVFKSCLLSGTSLGENLIKTTAGIKTNSKGTMLEMIPLTVPDQNPVIASAPT